jgi:hypothetical protein
VYRFHYTCSPRSRSRRDVQAMAKAMLRLGFAPVLAAKSCRERDLVLAPLVAGILAPQTKLTLTRWWRPTMLV